MFNIDKYLEDLSFKDVSPSDDLIEHTLVQCKSEMDKRASKRSRTKHKGGFFMNKSTYKRVGIIATPVLAVLVIGIFLATNFFSTKLNSVQTYYTVDINPSVCIGVDKNDVVREVVSQNDDAAELIKKIDVKGKSAELAIGKIIDTAKESGYIKDSEKYVLIGHFGKENKEFTKLQQSLEKNYGDTVKLLIVSGSLDDKKAADSLDVSAGMLKLSKQAQGVKVKKEDKVEDIIGTVNKKIHTNLCAPKLQVKVASESSVNLSWNKLDLNAIGFVGKVTYQIVMGDSEEQILQMNGQVVATMSYYSYGQQPLHYNLKSANAQFLGQATKYFAIYAKFDGSETVMCSNVVNGVLGEALTTSSSPASDNSNKNDTASSKTTTVAPSSAKNNAGASINNFSNIRGSILGTTVSLNWDKISYNGFEGYKVMYSFINSKPVYQNSGCHYAKWITNPNETSCSIDVTTLNGYTPGATCYFSITALYSSHNVKIAGNVISIPMPSAPAEPSYPYSNIISSVSGTTVNLSWDKINYIGFEGYKVMYSFVDSKPVYQKSGCYYAKWITNPDETSCSIDVTTLNGYTPGATCYFSITALYGSHSIKIPGNVIATILP